MSKRHLLRFTTYMFGFAVFFFFISSRPAVAGSVSITPAITGLTLTEGGSPIIVNFKVTNNTGATLLNTLFSGIITPLSGDISDNAGFTFLPSDTCIGLTSLGSGASCTLSVSISSPFMTVGGETETPPDSGVTRLIVGLTYLCPNCFGDTDPTETIGGQTFFAPALTFSVTAKDLGPTPEPSSLLLLGTGLLGLGPFIRRFAHL